MQQAFKILLSALRRECTALASRPLYMLCALVFPIFMGFFLNDILKFGSAYQVPSAVVDLDHSSLSRGVTRTLESLQTVKVVAHYASESEAREALQRGEIMGFYVIPEYFCDDALAFRAPKITYYTNYSYFVAGTLAYKGFKTTSVLASGAIVKTAMSSVGLSEETISAALQPYGSHIHALTNPFLHYGAYLANSFGPGILALLATIITIHFILMELKHGTARQWISNAGDSIVIAVTAKLLPLTVCFTLAGWGMQVWMYKFLGYPLMCPISTMMIAMLLLVLAAQGLGVLICCITPSAPRLAMSVGSLVCVLAFSVCALSFPLENMHLMLQPLSFIIPLRYYVLIYFDQALNGIDIFYSRYYFIALLIFIVLPALFLPRLKKGLKLGVYIP